MPITLVSANLNQYGNAGQFETDRSTWGFSNASFTVTRSSVQKYAGLYSALVTKTGLGDSLLIPCRYFSELGKKYVLRAWVRVPSAAPIGAGAAIITMESSLDNISLTGTPFDLTDKTVTEATDTWVQIEAFIEHTNALFLSLNNDQYIRISAANLNGQIFIDSFEVYEYIGTSDPDPDPDPEPEEVDKVFFSRNPITLQKQATIGWGDLTNYRLYNDVRVEDVADSGTFVSKLKVAQVPESDGKVIFYLAEAFRGVFTFTPPTLNQSNIVRLTDRIKRFKSYSGELQNTETTPGSLTTSSVSDLALWGGISKLEFPDLDFFSTYLPANKKFMTWAPTTKTVDRLQEDYLNFFIYDELIVEFNLVIKAYFDDATNETEEIATVTGTQYGYLYQIPAGPANSGVLTINPAKNVIKYELWLTNHTDTIISEVRTYTITPTAHPLTRYFLYLNSLGSFEVLRFTGIAEQRAEFQREVVQKFLPHNYTALDGEFESNLTRMRARNSFSSGFLQKQWHEYMKDFLLSRRVYDITTGQRVPVNITAGEWQAEDQNYLSFIRFEARPAYEDVSYTPLL